MPFYAIARGRVPGIYTSWNEAKRQIDGFNGAKYKKFETRDEAQEFITTFKVFKPTSIDKMLDVIEDPKEDDKCLIVFTDGAARNNNNIHVKTQASFAIVWPYHEEYDIGMKLDPSLPQTNNRAELSGVLHALLQADVIDPDINKTLIIYTDSMLIVNSFTSWITGWERNNWKKSDGTEVSNLDLVTKIHDLMKKRKVVFRHVRAHTGKNTWEAKYNDKVDRLARSEIA